MLVNNRTEKVDDRDGVATVTYTEIAAKLDNADADLTLFFKTLDECFGEIVQPR